MEKALNLSRLILHIVLIVLVIWIILISYAPGLQVNAPNFRVTTVQPGILRLTDVLIGATCYYIPPFALSCVTPERAG